MTKLSRPFLFFPGIAVLAFISGCVQPRLSSQQELDLDSNDIRTILIDPSGSAQTVSIVANTDGPPINVYVYLSEDDDAVDRAIMFGKTLDKVITSQTDSAQISLSAKIPANKEASVRLQTASPDSAKVTLKISN